MKNTYLFGPSGFLGPAILEKSKKIVAVGRSKPPFYIKNRFIKIKSFENLNVLKKEKIEKVIFCIGNSNHHSFLNKEDLHLSLGYNVLPLVKLLDFFEKNNFKIKKVITFTGALLYKGKNFNLPAKENLPLDSYQNKYIFSKFLAEQVTNFFSKKFPIINVRLSNIYGPTIYKRPDLLLSIFGQILKGKKTISIWNKKPIRDFIHTSDVSDAIIKLLNSKFTGHINVGYGKSYSIKKVTKEIEKISNIKIIDKKIKVSGPMNYKHSIAKLKKVTNFKPSIDIKTGLKKTLDRIKYLKRQHEKKN